MFVWNDSGTIRCTRGPAWTNSGAFTSTRGTGAGTTELEQFEGRYVNKVAITNGPAARRGVYVGSVRTNGSTQLTDFGGTRLVWNMFNRHRRDVYVFETTDTWTYSTATWREANGATTNRVIVFNGSPTGNLGEVVDLRVQANAVASDANPQTARVAIGQGSTTSPGTDAGGRTSIGTASLPNATHGSVCVFASAVYTPGTGYAYYTWLERGTATGGGDTTWIGDNGAVNDYQAGMYGTWTC
jgi:hypothetical protein